MTSIIGRGSSVEVEMPDDLVKSGGSRLDALETQVTTFQSLSDKLRLASMIFALVGVAGLGGAIAVRDTSRDTATRVTSLESRLTQDEATLRDTGNELREMRVSLGRMQVLMEQMVNQLDGLGRRLDRSAQHGSGRTQEDPR